MYIFFRFKYMQAIKKTLRHALLILSLTIVVLSASLFVAQSSVFAAPKLSVGTTNHIVIKPMARPRDTGNTCSPGGSVVYDQRYYAIWYKGEGICDVGAQDLVDAVGVQVLPPGGSWHYVDGPHSRSCSGCSVLYNPGPGSTPSYLYNIRDASNYRVVETGSYQIGTTRSSYGAILWQLR